MATTDDTRLAHTADQFTSLTAGEGDWFIRSANDVSRHLDGPGAPLAGLPADAVKAFKDSLVFQKGGLAHANYSSLVDHISLKQFHALWACFGMSPRLSRDYDHKYCSNTAGSHICDNAYFEMCSSNCGY